MEGFGNRLGISISNTALDEEKRFADSKTFQVKQIKVFEITAWTALPLNPASHFVNRFCCGNESKLFPFFHFRTSLECRGATGDFPFPPRGQASSVFQFPCHCCDIFIILHLDVVSF
jgi:hypothetical protein